MNFKIIHKKVGETPLEAIERFRAGHSEYADLASVPMTYAGRLDPMAEGKLLILIGDECKNKEKYLGLDKEYEVEILFGVDTDTHDVLGRILKVNTCAKAAENFSKNYVQNDLQNKLQNNVQKYVGKFEQKYPAFSSRTVGGKALHVHARAGTLPEDGDDLDSSNSSNWPKKSVEIYSIEVLEICSKIGNVVATQAIENIGQLKEKVEGDFRKKEILQDWGDFEKKYGEALFTIIKIRVACSSGTYMRSLAKRMGDDIGGDTSIGALAFSIVRTKIGEY
jgi:tRNA pseudouridine(55) synthase